MVSAAREPDSFWQVFFFQLTPDGVVPWIGHVGQPVGHSQRKEKGGVCPYRDAGIALLDLVQGHPADGGPLCQDRHGDAPPPPGIANVMA